MRVLKKKTISNLETDPIVSKKTDDVLKANKLTWKYCLEKLYDTVVCIFSVLDVFFDLLVTYQFYIEGHTYFLIISLFILFAAQISYAVFMACALEPIKRNNTFIHRYNVIVFFVTLPFGQAVPLFLMVYSSYPAFFNKYFRKCGYRFSLAWDDMDLFNAGPATNSRRNRHFDEFDDGRYLNDIECNRDVSDVEVSFTKEQIGMNDPFSNFIRQKLISHFGFIIEAVIESIPQSILQMIFLILYHSSSSYSIINVVSIIMSMSVVSSKGTLLSYSIYRKASIFNFLCFAIDIFGIFTISAWLFVLSDGSGNGEINDDYNFFGYNLWPTAYHYFNMLYYIYMTLIWMAFWGFNLLLIETYKQYRNCPWRNFMILILLPIGAVLLVIPVSLTALTVRFTLIPVFLLQAFDHSQNRSYSFYNKLYSFITDSKSIPEIHEKILVTNWTLARIVKQTSDNQKQHFTGKYLCDGHTIKAAESLCKTMDQHYENNGNVSLSNLYNVLRNYNYSYWTHYKYHQIYELIALLITKKEFWKFIIIKISGDLFFKEDANDMEKYKELEIEFWNTIQQIQDIIDWDGFMLAFRRNWTQFLIQLTLIRLWFNNLNWREVGNTIYLLLGYIVRDVIWREWIKVKAPQFIKWFSMGLYRAIKQDVVNLYNSIMRVYDTIINNRGDRYVSAPPGRTALTLKQHSSLIEDAESLKKSYKNQQILEWNLPKCWSSWKLIFKGSSLHRRSSDSYIYYSNYRDYNEPWIGRGIFVFIVVIIFKCIHIPIRNLYTHRSFEDFCAVMIGGPAFLIVLPLVLCVAIYSIFAPILFLIQQWIHFGFFNCLEHNLLQMIFTFGYLIIFTGIVILVPKVWKFVYADWHLYRYFTDKKPTPSLYASHVVHVFESRQIRDDLLDDCFGPDLSGLIKSYLPHYQIWIKDFE